MPEVRRDDAGPNEPDPLSLFPRGKDLRGAGPVESLGARTLGALESGAGLLATLKGALAAPLAPGEAAREVSRRVTLRQIFFTGFEALPLVSLIAALIGATMILQMQIMAPGMPDELVGMILVAVVLRELAPLITAVVVAGRSGTAMATELGNMQVNAEVLALSSLGVDPMRFVVLPRLLATIVSVMVLTIYFGIVAILTGYLVGMVTAASTFASLRSGFAAALQAGDLALYVIKCGGLGTLVGWLCCHFGLSVRGSPTEVPQRASQAVVMSLLACVAYNAVVTAGFYWVVGVPGR